MCAVCASPFLPLCLKLRVASPRKNVKEHFHHRHFSTCSERSTLHIRAVDVCRAEIFRRIRFQRGSPPLQVLLICRTERYFLIKDFGLSFGLERSYACFKMTSLSLQYLKFSIFRSSLGKGLQRAASPSRWYWM
jgi:hypothetical protein